MDSGKMPSEVPCTNLQTKMENFRSPKSKLFFGTPQCCILCQCFLQTKFLEDSAIHHSPLAMQLSQGWMEWFISVTPATLHGGAVWYVHMSVCVHARARVCAETEGEMIRTRYHWRLSKLPETRYLRTAAAQQQPLTFVSIFHRPHHLIFTTTPPGRCYRGRSGKGPHPKT